MESNEEEVNKRIEECEKELNDLVSNLIKDFSEEEKGLD